MPFGGIKSGETGSSSLPVRKGVEEPCCAGLAASPVGVPMEPAVARAASPARPPAPTAALMLLRS